MKNIKIKSDKAVTDIDLNNGDYEITFPLADLKKAIQENPELKEELAKELFDDHFPAIAEEVKTGYFLPKNREYYWFFNKNIRWIFIPNVPHADIRTNRTLGEPYAPGQDSGGKFIKRSREDNGKIKI